MIIRWLATLALIAAPGLAQAQEGSGCSGFKWPLDHERAALVRTDKASLPNGGAIPYDVAMTLGLQPLSAAGLPKAPERAPKSPPRSPAILPLARRQSRALIGSRSPRKAGSTSSTAAPTCIRLGSPAPGTATARARASSSTFPLGRSRSNSAASRAIKSPLSFLPTNSFGRVSFDDVRVPYCPCALGRGSVSVGNAAYS